MKRTSTGLVAIVTRKIRQVIENQKEFKKQEQTKEPPYRSIKL